MPHNSPQKQISRIPSHVWVGCLIFLPSPWVATVRLSGHVACVLVALDAPVISVQRWFDRVALQSFAVLRNVIHVLSARSFVHITKLSMFLVVSVVERPFGCTHVPGTGTAHVTFRTRSHVSG